MKKINTKNKNNQKGIALIMLLVFSIIAIAVTTVGVSIMINITRSSGILQSRIAASQAAEGGLENGILRLLRDPGYTGETLTLGDSTVTITVSGTGPYTITSKAQYFDFSQTVEATVAYNDNKLTVSGWNFIY